MRTLAHLSDLHFGRVDAALLDPLRHALEAISPDLVVVSGDLTQRARASQFEAARAWLATLPRPQLVVPGNHDVPLYNVLKRFAAPLASYRRAMGDDVEPVYIDGEIAVVGVDTTRSNVFKGGRINTAQVDRIREALCNLPREVVRIVVTHHPFDAPGEAAQRPGHVVGRARMALEGLVECGADLLLSGHLHEAAVLHTAERYAIAGMSALVVQAGTATSVRTRETPNTFNVLRVSPHHVQVERHAWNGSTFAADASQAFDRDASGWHAAQPS